MDKNIPTGISLIEAAKGMVTALISAHDAEMMLASAIEHGDLHANIKRWSTEQWEGKQLPGNINRLETFIERSDLADWKSRQK